MRNAPLTTPTLSVVFTTLCARSVSVPVRSGSPDAEPVYVPLVTEIDFASLDVQDRVVTPFAVAAENVAETDRSDFVPLIPLATATLVAASATRPTIVSVSLRIESLRSLCRRKACPCTCGSGEGHVRRR